MEEVHTLKDALRVVKRNDLFIGLNGWLMTFAGLSLGYMALQENNKEVEERRISSFKNLSRRFKNLSRHYKDFTFYIANVWFGSFVAGAAVYEVSPKLATNYYAPALAYFTYAAVATISILIGGSKYIAHLESKSAKE
jgi:hypothetical protein